MKAFRGRVLIPLLLSALTVGCGGDEKTAPPAAQKSGPPPAQVIKQVQPANENGPRIRPRDQPPAKTTELEAWPEGVPRDDVFRAFSQPNGNYVIGEESGGPHPDDWCVAVAPPVGADSSQLMAVLPEWAVERGSQAAGARLPAGFTVDPSSGYSGDGWPKRIRCDADGSSMVYIPGGAFIQGMDGVDQNAAPAHPADIDSFYIDVTEVTIGQYARFLEQGAASADRPPQEPANAGAPLQHPALGVTWGDAQAYAKWSGKSLPTESEWELAARGPRAFVHPWGNGRPVWHRARTPDQIEDVGAFPNDRSVYGVLDVAGNAREWVSDFYHPVAYGQAKSVDGSVIRNWTGPKRPSPANHKVVKGGGPNWELWHRGSASMRSPEPDISFRCVLRIKDAGTGEPTATGAVSPRETGRGTDGL